MHVNTLAWLKSDRIGFLMVELKHLDSRLIVALLLSRGREPEVEGRRLSSQITANKSAIVYLVCVIIMYIIYEMYKDVALYRSSYAIFLECQCSLLLLVT